MHPAENVLRRPCENVAELALRESNKPRFLSMKPRGSKAVRIRSNGYDAEFFGVARGADRLE